MNLFDLINENLVSASLTLTLTLILIRKVEKIIKYITKK